MENRIVFIEGVYSSDEKKVLQGYLGDFWIQIIRCSILRFFVENICKSILIPFYNTKGKFWYGPDNVQCARPGISY